MPGLRRILFSPLIIVTPAVLLIFVYLGSILSSNAYENFDYGIHYAKAQAQNGYWEQAYADEIIHQSLTAFVPSFLTPLLIVAGVVVALLIIQRWLRFQVTQRS